MRHHFAKVRVASSNLVARSDKLAGQGPFMGPRLASGEALQITGRDVTEVTLLPDEQGDGDRVAPVTPPLGGVTHDH